MYYDVGMQIVVLWHSTRVGNRCLIDIEGSPPLLAERVDLARVGDFQERVRSRFKAADCYQRRPRLVQKELVDGRAAGPSKSTAAISECSGSAATSAGTGSSNSRRRWTG